MFPSVAVAPDGTPYVAWHDYNPVPTEIYVRRWNGSSWEEVGAGSASGAHAPNEHVRLSDIDRAARFNCTMFDALGQS